jgi:hypothetical protein
MKLTRREWLAGTAALGAVSTLSGCVGSRTGAGQVSAGDLIARENQLEGTRDWMLAKTAVDPKTRYRCPWVEGYCSHRSVRAGETIRFYVSTKPASSFTIDLYRMGYYGGAGGRHMARLGPFAGEVQPDPPVGANRLRECRWGESAALSIPEGWVSGVYLGKLTTAEGWQSYVIFVVRDDRRADFAFQCADHTWQAYNRWPSQFSLYDDGKQQWYCGPGVDVSFDRPYGKYCQILDAPLSQGSGEFFLWEFPFAFWLEREGYDVTYISNLDTHADPTGLRRTKGFLSVGHDEYYSIEMFNQLLEAAQAGLSLGFFSGNSVCGRVDPRPSTSGRANRIFGRVDYFGPRDPGMLARFPSMAAFPYRSPHERDLMGARNVPPCTGGSDWTCVAPEHWVFDGTNMQRGEGIPGLVGWEFHGDPAPIPGLAVVASGPTQDAPGKPNGGTFTATIHAGERGNVIFNASTCWWGDSLSEPPGYIRPSVYTTPRGPDARAQRITANILEAMRRREFPVV